MTDVDVVSVSWCQSYPIRKHNITCTEGGCSIFLCKGGLPAAWHLQTHSYREHKPWRSVTCHIYSDKVGAVNVQSQMCPFQHSYSTCPTEHKTKSEIPGGSGQPLLDLLFPNFPLLLLLMVLSSSFSWFHLLS